MNVGHWLSKADRAMPVDLIVCLDGDRRIIKAAALYHRGIAPEILLTVRGKKNILVNMGVAAAKVHLASNVKTTYEEAIAARRFIESHSRIKSAIIVTDPHHLYRARWSFERLFHDSGVTLLFVGSDSNWTASEWYRKRGSRYMVASEVSKTLFYWVCHQVLGCEGDAPWMLELQLRYLRWLDNFL